VLKKSAAGCAVLVFLAGCVHQYSVPLAAAPPEPTNTAPPPKSGVAPAPPAPATQAVQPDQTAQATEKPPAGPPPSPGSRPVPRGSATAGANASTTKSSGKPPAAAPAAGGTSQSVPAAAQRQGATAQPALDLAALEQRLRDTHAIGLFTKLSLKNQVDDLLAQFREFHQGQSTITLAELRQHFELLLLKVVSLLQNGDAQLAAAVSSSRDAIWAVLVDPAKFSKI
jgi:hypothetical protein